MTKYSLTVLLLLIGGTVFGQYVTAPTTLINTPTVATLDRGAYQTEVRFSPNGGVLAGVEVGFTDRISLGLSYGGAEIIGNNTVKWNPQPGIFSKYRVIDEKIYVPGISLGFSGQGHGEYFEDHYQIPSPGFYMVASKNWKLIGNTSLHAGINYSLEQPKENKTPSFFFGTAMELNPQLSLMLEYDAALNYENSEDTLDFVITNGYGFLNAGVRVGITENVFIEIDFTNLIWDDKKVESFNRELKFIFFNMF